MNDDQIRELCQILKPFIGQRADALWLSYVSSETPKAKLETEALIQIFALRDLSRQVEQEAFLFQFTPCHGSSELARSSIWGGVNSVRER